MAIPGYLAMTPAQFRQAQRLPEHLAWMSCHFSPEGLTDLPDLLPPGSLLILDDSIRPEKPDPDRVIPPLHRAVTALGCSGVLLDFQGPVSRELGQLAGELSRALPCPVAVTEAYGSCTEGPLFLSMLRPHQSLRQQVLPWAGRELWMELGPCREVLSLRQEGPRFAAAPPVLPPLPFRDRELCCSYRIDCLRDRADFTLCREGPQLRALLDQARQLGITRYAGLWEELRRFP